jgi:hypothetical protein
MRFFIDSKSGEEMQGDVLKFKTTNAYLEGECLSSRKLGESVV